MCEYTIIQATFMPIYKRIIIGIRMLAREHTLYKPLGCVIRCDRARIGKRIALPLNVAYTQKCPIGISLACHIGEWIFIPKGRHKKARTRRACFCIVLSILFRTLHPDHCRDDTGQTSQSHIKQRHTAAICPARQKRAETHEHAHKRQCHHYQQPDFNFHLATPFVNCRYWLE